MSTIELNIDKSEYVPEITIEQEIYTVELYKETTPNTIEVAIDRTGSAGISAYQAWLNEGNEGTEQDFLDSLVGADGKTAYGSAQDGGYTGTEAQFNTDLADVSTKESTSNKKTDIEANKESNIFYATIKAIYDWCVGKFEPLKGDDDNYVTDAEKVKLNNLSGTNTGDQDLSGLQLKLVSGENIKTLNNESLLGDGNITITASSTTDNVTITGEGTEASPFQISDEYKLRINAGI